MTLSTPRFTRVNEPFVCVVCGEKVPPASQTCRDHCPYCLWSRHVDVLPGDRSADCGGPLRPCGYEKHAKKGIMILYRCETCGEQRRNRFLEADEVCPDSYEALLSLTPQFPGGGR